MSVWTNLKELSHHRRKIHALDWNSDGSKLASGDGDGCVCIWGHALTSKEVSRQKSGNYVLSVTSKVDHNISNCHKSGVESLTWHPNDPHTIITAGQDLTWRLLDLRTGTDPKHVHTLSTRPISVSWNPDAYRFACARKSDSVDIVDTRKLAVVHTIQTPAAVNNATWSAGGDVLACACSDGSVALHQFPGEGDGAPNLVRSLSLHSEKCYGLSMDSSGRYLASGGDDGCVHVYCMRSGRHVLTRHEHEQPVRDVALFSSGEWVALTSGDLNVEVVECQTGAVLWNVVLSKTAESVAWHPSMPLLAYDCEDDTSRMCHVRIAGLSGVGD